ncbi:MAG TPA: hypothetical protein VIV60_19235 [Polyangiaceae bacterium]
MEKYFDVGMAYAAVADAIGLAEAKVTIDLAFKRERWRALGSQWLSIACSGAWLELSTTGGEFTTFSCPDETTGTAHITEKSSTSANLKHRSIERSGSRAVERSVDASVQTQSPLSASINPQRREITWSFEIDRSAKTVRDCLDGNEALFATLQLGTKIGEIALKCSPTDVGVFDARNRRLSTLAQIGCMVKLRELPDLLPKKRTYTVSVPARPSRREVG